MNWIETIILILVLVMIVMTAIAEPLTSIKYFKGMAKSGITIFKWCWNVIQGLQHASSNTTACGVNDTKC